MSDPLSIEDICTEAATAVSRMAERLVVLEREIRAAQPVRDRAVLMYLYRHDPHCLGCPHVIWKQWRSHPRRPIHRWSAHRIDSPLRHLPRREDCSQARPLIHEAVDLAAHRQVLVHHISALARSLSHLDRAPS